MLLGDSPTLLQVETWIILWYSSAQQAFWHLLAGNFLLIKDHKNLYKYGELGNAFLSCDVTKLESLLENWGSIIYLRTLTKHSKCNGQEHFISILSVKFNIS